MRGVLRHIAASACCAGLLFAVAACGGDGGTGDATRPASTPGSSPDAQATAGRTVGPRTPERTGAAATAPAGDPGAAPTLPSDPTALAQAGAAVLGGDPSAPRAAVGDVPTPPPDARIDPTAVVPPPADAAGGLALAVDVDAAAPGLQGTRTVRAGDVVRVAVVVSGLPADGLNAFNLFLDYDRGLVVAPSYTGGPPTDRNPDLYEASLGEGAMCVPAPEGDLDDEGGIPGDGDPRTGRALLACFSTSPGPAGTVVLATVEFRAAGSGSARLALSGVSLAGGEAVVDYGRCAGDPGPALVIPCEGGVIVVE